MLFRTKDRYDVEQIIVMILGVKASHCSGGHMLIIWMTLKDLENLAEFLNERYEQKRQAHRREGRRFSITDFAVEVGISQSTMTRMMRLGPRQRVVEGLDVPILLALWDYFGADAIEALRGDAEMGKAKNKEKQKTRG